MKETTSVLPVLMSETAVWCNVQCPTNVAGDLKESRKQRLLCRTLGKSGIDIKKVTSLPKGGRMVKEKKGRHKGKETAQSSASVFESKGD